MSVCPICKTPTARDKFMCLKHWRMVPAAAQKRVYSAWSAYKAAVGGARIPASEMIKVLCEQLAAQQAALDAFSIEVMKERGAK